MALCSHTDQVKVTELPPEVPGCEDCLAVGDPWLHLRICLECGHVGCCDDSPNKHATAHAEASGHPLIRSLEPGDRWGWCYVDRRLYDPMPTDSVWKRLKARFAPRRGTDTA